MSANRRKAIAAARRGFSAQRYVWTFGDPAWNSGNGTAGWWTLFPTISSTGFVRDSESNDPVTPSRIYFDDSQFPNLMSSLSGSYGNSPAGAGPCRTVRCEIRDSDPLWPGIPSGAHGSEMRLDPGQDQNAAYGTRPSSIVRQGDSWFFGFSCATDPNYVPYGADGVDLVFGGFNSFGLELHSTIGILGPIMQNVSCCWPSDASERNAGPNGGVWYKRLGNPNVLIPGGPRLEIDLTAGVNDASTDDATHTCRGFYGPAFVAGRRYKTIYYVHFDAFQNGAFKWWVDDGQGAGYVLYADMSGISTLWRDGSGNPDTGTYTQMLNYRKSGGIALPNAVMFFAGYARGPTFTDVVIP